MTGNVILRAYRYLVRKLVCVANISVREGVGGVVSAWRFSNHRPEGKSILLVEPNEFHAEVLPSLINYFNLLGYSTTLLIRRKNAREGVFSRLEANELPSVFVMGPRLMSRCIQKRGSRDYSCVFVSSSHLANTGGYWGVFWDYARGFSQKSNRMLTIVHNFQHVKRHITAGRIDPWRILLLAPYHEEGRGYLMLNPHYFGKIETHRLNQHRIFITVGSVTAENRNFQQLTNAVSELEEAGITNFEVQVIGKGATPELFMDSSHRIKPLGYLGFEDMYQALEDADFYLPLLDPSDDNHRRYLAGQTTGSRQLILGFRKVAVINRVFADSFGLSTTNALLYEGQGLANGMRQAMDISSDDYRKLCQLIESYSEQIKSESLANLESKINECLNHHPYA